MRKRLLLWKSLMILLSLSLHYTASAETPDEEGLYLQLSRGIVRLEHDSLSYRDSQIAPVGPIPDGTAFFVGHKNDHFIVTARHVAEVPYDLHARVQLKNKETKRIEVLRLELPRGRWVFHTSSGSKETHYVDVAVMKITWPEEKRFDFKCVRYNPQKKDEHDFAGEDPLPPDLVYVFGFPGDIGFEMTRQKPLASLGVVSMVAGEELIKANGKYLPNGMFLVDANVFPGNSGSPVLKYRLAQLGERGFALTVELAGLVSARLGNTTFHTIQPASRIAETINDARQQSLQGAYFWCGPLPEHLQRACLSCEILNKEVKIPRY